MENETIMINNDDHSVKLELGDIIQIVSPANEEYHEQTFMIEYIDEQNIRLIHLTTFAEKTLNILDGRYLSDESITQIKLLGRSEEAGYARQNKLLPQTWVDIHFGGEFPTVVTGEITNLEEDMIEITTYPAISVLYIDFEYKGIPATIPIRSIVIRERPASAKSSLSAMDLEDVGEEPDTALAAEASIAFTESGESIISIPENAKSDENIHDVLHKIYLDAADIFGDELAEITVEVEVPESQKRYGVDVQVTDLMDELLSTIPNSKRTKRVMDNLSLLIERFKELRAKFSTFDANGNVVDVAIKGAGHKPLLEKLGNLNTRIQWAIPVVQNRRKMYIENASQYSEDIAEDVATVLVSDAVYDQYTAQRDFEKNTGVGEGLKYVRMFQSMTDTMTPYEEPTNPAHNVLVHHREIQANIDCIVHNLENFCASSRTVVSYPRQGAVHTDIPTRFVIERYNLGVMRPESVALKHGQKIFLRKPLMPADKITLKSVLMLPEPIMHLSRVELPGTSILDRTELARHPLQLFRLLNKRTKVHEHSLEDLNQAVPYADPENPNDENMRFLSKIVNYSVSEDVEHPDYQEFLNAILPQTHYLIQTMQKYMANRPLSVVDALQVLEPFYVYAEDITYQQYNSIRFFIKHQVKAYKTSIAQKEQEMMKMRNVRKPVNKFTNVVMRTFAEKSDLLGVFCDAYKVDVNALANYTNAEILLKIAEMDGGAIFDVLVSRMLLSLTTPHKILDALDHPYVEDMSKIDKIKPTDCARRFLTKKYTSITELQKDNNIENIYYDTEYDDTPYHILKKYADKQKKMVPTDFVDYLAENLIAKHDCNSVFAKELASTMIAGKKTVKSGEYALLELAPQLPKDVDPSKLTKRELAEIEHEGRVRGKTHYYKRMNDHWVRDESISEEAFLDNQSLFCNIDTSCYKNQVNQQCDTMERSHAKMDKLSHEKVFGELDKRLAITVEEMEQQLENTLERGRKQISRNAALRQIQAYKQNLVSYELGKQTQLEDLIVSPYAKLLDWIMGQDDFIKKQNDLCTFVTEYCREAMVIELKEEAQWLYCKETNVKLLPVSIKMLAQAFVYGDYQQTLAELCHSHGRQSDDGDAIIDKYSGWELQKNDFVAQDEYDDAGFKIVSHGILEKDVGQVIAETLAKKGREFEDADDQMAYNVFAALCYNGGIPTEFVEEFVLRCALELIRNRAVILSEDSYKKRVDEAAKKTDKAERVPVPWPIYKHQSIIGIVGACVLVAAQCAIPTIKTRKIYPGCVKSFAGYPMTGIEDVSGIKYIACVLHGSKTDEAPWASIQKLNVSAIAARIRDALDKHITKRNDVQELYANKRAYLVLQPDEVVPEEHSVSKWRQFLPPMVSIGVIAGLRTVSSDFKAELRETLKKGSKSQREHIDMLKSKINAHGYGVIEQIYDIVAKKNALLQTAAGKAFLQNACCNEANKSTHPLSYFMAENPAIEQYIHVANDLGKTLNDVRELSTAPFFYHPASTWAIRPEMPKGQIEQNIYAAFIHYCRYDRPGLAVPEEFAALCGERPAGYQPFWSIEEKTEFLKKHGKKFDAEALLQLMGKVNQRNTITITQSAETPAIAALTDFLETMEKYDSEVIPHPLRNLLGKVIDGYKPRDMKKEDPSLTNLRKYVGKVNGDMLKEIVDFIQGCRSVELDKINEIQSFLATITKWQSDDKEGDAIYTVCHFMRNAVESMAKVYPSTILYKTQKPKVNVQWNLSKHHYEDIWNIMCKHLASLKKYKDDASIIQVFHQIGEQCVNLHLFLQHIPIETPIHKNDATYFELFDKKTLYMLHSYCYLSVLYEYMKMAMDDDMMHYDLVVSRQERREMMDEGIDAPSTMDINMGDDVGALENVDIRGGDREAFRKRICSLLIDFITIDFEHKAMMDKSYSDIARKIRKSKQEEKKVITDYLENMEKDERKTEDMLKQLKLGRWNVGIQKGVFSYDKQTYERERNDILHRLEADLAQDVLDVDLAEMTVEDLYADAEQAAGEYDDDGLDIAAFGDDYLDGNYYGDEGDDDFAYDN